ncbi:MAG: tetratricopeptide repeat protein [Gemmatimonadota bacterium]
MGTSARIDELMKKFEENPRRYFAPLANEYRKSGNLEQAIEICRQHLTEQPGHMSGHIVFGQALFEASRLDEAEQVFSSALALDPENLIALRHLGDIAHARGDAPGARTWYQRVLDADPRNEEIAGLVRDLAAKVSVEGFAGLAPDDDGAGRTAEPGASASPAAAESGPAAPALPGDLDDGMPGALDPVAEALRAEDAAVFAPMAFPGTRAPTVPPTSALPPERIVEPLPDTLEIAPQEVQRLLEASRAISPPAPDDLEMPSAEELRHPPLGDVPSGDPLADLPMEMLEGFGDASADSLLGGGSGFPDPESPLLHLEAQVAGLVPDDESPLGLTSGQTDAAVEFMDDPLGDLAAAVAEPPQPMFDLQALPEQDTTDALATEPPLPPPVPPSFALAEPEDPVAAPRLSAATPATPATPAGRAAAPRVPTPAASPAFVTEAMGEVLERQGLYAQAAEVYRALLAARPGDPSLARRLAEIEARFAPAGLTARVWLQRLAAGGLGAVSPTTAPAAAAVTGAVAPVNVLEVTAVTAARVATDPAGRWPTGLEALFGPPTNPADEAAALALAALYDGSTAMPGAPTAPARDELSLKAVFEPPPAPRTSAAFSFDQFFSAAPRTAAEAPAGGETELAEFSRWLDGLKRQ